MKKILKIIMVAIMVLGIAFSVSNFISIETKADGVKGVWVSVDGEWFCMGDGNDCSSAF